MGMQRPLRFALLATIALLGSLPAAALAAPEGTLTAAVATFGNERWLPHLYVSAEDVGLKPMHVHNWEYVTRT